MSHTYHKAEQIVLGYKVLSLCHEAQGCIPQRGDGVWQLDCCNCLMPLSCKDSLSHQGMLQVILLEALLTRRT